MTTSTSIRYDKPNTNFPTKKTIEGEVGIIEVEMGDVAGWMLDEARAFAVSIAAKEVEKQRAIDNPPQQVLVDGSLTKSFSDLRKTIDVLFEGAGDARPAMLALEAQVASMKLQWFSGKPFPVGRWTWISTNPSVTVRANSGASTSVPLALGDTLYYIPRPTGSGIAAALAATNAPKSKARAEKDAVKPLKSGRARKGKGVMAATSSAANRTARGYGFSIKAGQSFKAARAEGRVPWLEEHHFTVYGAARFLAGPSILLATQEHPLMDTVEVQRLIRLRVDANQLVAESERARRALRGIGEGASQGVASTNKVLGAADQQARRMGNAFQNVGYQATDLFVVLEQGQAPMRAFAQQGSQAAAAFAIVGGTLGKIAIPASIAIAVFGSLGGMFLKAMGSASQALEAFEATQESIDALASAAEDALVPVTDLVEEFGSLGAAGTVANVQRLQAFIAEREAIEAVTASIRERNETYQAGASSGPGPVDRTSSTFVDLGLSKLEADFNVVGDAAEAFRDRYAELLADVEAGNFGQAAKGFEELASGIDASTEGSKAAQKFLAAVAEETSRLAKLTGDLADISGKSAEERLKEEKAAKALVDAQKLVTSAIASSGTEYDKLSRKYAEQAAALALVTAAGELSARQQYDMQEALRATAKAIDELRSKPFEIIEGLEQTLEEQLALNEAIGVTSGRYDALKGKFDLEKRVKEAREEQEKFGAEAKLHASTIRANADAAEYMVRRLAAAEAEAASLTDEARRMADEFRNVASAIASVGSSVASIELSNIAKAAELAALRAGETKEAARAEGEIARAQEQLRPGFESAVPGDNLAAAKVFNDILTGTKEQLAIDTEINGILKSRKPRGGSSEADDIRENNAELDKYLVSLEREAEAQTRLAAAAAISADEHEKVKNAIDIEDEVSRAVEQITKLSEAAALSPAATASLIETVTAQVAETQKLAQETEEALRKMTQTSEKLRDAIEDSIGDSMTSFIDQMFDAELSFSEMAESMLEDIAKIILKMQALKAIEAISGALPGFGGGASSFSTGGGVGGVASAAGGGGIGGLGVAAFGALGVGALGYAASQGGGGGNQTTGTSTASGNVNVQVINQTQAKVEVAEERSSDGGRMVRMLIRNEVQGAIGDGSMDKTFRANYGIRRAGTR